MNVYTSQLAKLKGHVSSDTVFIKDITVKSGDRAFAPEWSWLLAYKNKLIDEAKYTQLFEQKMLSSLDSFTERWDALIQKDTVILACYCRAGVFCHRHLLKDYLELYCIDQQVPFAYLGEYPRR